MKAMKAMKKKPVSAKLAKRHAFFGKIDKTATGLKKSDLVQNKYGKVVSKKKAAKAKSVFGGWLASCKGPQSSEHQGFRSYQEGYSTLQEGQGVVSVNALSNLRRARGSSSRC